MSGETETVVTAIADKFMPLDLITWLNRYADTEPNTRGQTDTVDGAIVDQTLVRRSDIAWLDPAQNAALLNVLSSFVKGVNERTFHLKLVGFAELLQVATYRSEESGFFDWHVDLGVDERANRKLSLIAAMTDPAKYEGGELQILPGPEPVTIQMPLGRIVALHSSIPHRITPVTSGVCRNLVAWVS